MFKPMAYRLAWASFLVLGISAQAQTVGPRTPEGPGHAGADQPSSSTADVEKEREGSEKSKSDTESEKPRRRLLERICASVSQEEDPDGPINTDRPTFKPANTVAPVGRLQFESGFTFNSQQTPQTRSSVYDFPDLAMRYG